MTIVFAGSPEIAVPSLTALAMAQLEGAPWELAAVLTNADTPKGRAGTPSPTPVARAAQALSKRLQAAGHRPAALYKTPLPRSLSPSPGLLVSFAYGHIFTAEFLAGFALGGINVHPSLLPKYRGAAPLQQAILDGAAETGITIQRLAPRFDTGAILASEAFPLTGGETTASLSALIAEKAAALLCATLRALTQGGVKERPQNDAEASYCSQFKKSDGVIDWTRAARAIDARVRAFTPWPLSWSFANGRRLYILEGNCVTLKTGDPVGTVLGVDRERGILIQTGEEVFAATRLQWEGRKPLQWNEFINGARGLVGTALVPAAG